MNAPRNTELDTLAQRVTAAYVELDARLSGNSRRFPVAQFNELWRALQDYWSAMRGRSWLHRDVARVVSGLRVDLELEIFATPSDVLRRVDRMECLLFADYDAYPDDDDPSGLKP